MKKNEMKILSLLVLVYVASSCEMAEKYKSKESAKTFLIEGSKKASDIEKALGGCSNGMMVVEAFTDQTKSTFEIHASAFVSEKAVEKGGFSVMGMSDLKDAKGFKDKGISDVKLELHYHGATEKSAEADVKHEIAFQKVGGKLVVKGDESRQSLESNDDLNYSSVRKASNAMKATEAKGVGDIDAFSIKIPGTKDLERDFPPDVLAGSDMKSVSAAADQKLIIVIPVGVAPPASVIDMVSVEIFMKPNNPKEPLPEGIYYGVTPKAVDGKVKIEVPVKGVIPGDVVVDVTRHFFSKGSLEPVQTASAEPLNELASNDDELEVGDLAANAEDDKTAEDAAPKASSATPVCIDSRSTARMSGVITK